MKNTLIPLLCLLASCSLSQNKSFKPSEFNVPPGDWRTVGGQYDYGELFTNKEVGKRITFYNNNGKIYSLDYKESDRTRQIVFDIWDQIERAHDFYRTRDTAGKMNYYKDRINYALANLELNEAKWKQVVVTYKKVDADGCIRDFTITVPKGITVPDSFEVVKLKIHKIGIVTADSMISNWEFGPEIVERKMVKKEPIPTIWWIIGGYTIGELAEISRTDSASKRYFGLSDTSALEMIYFKH